MKIIGTAMLPRSPRTARTLQTVRRLGRSRVRPKDPSILPDKIAQPLPKLWFAQEYDPKKRFLPHSSRWRSAPSIVYLNNSQPTENQLSLHASAKRHPTTTDANDKIELSKATSSSSSQTKTSIRLNALLPIEKKEMTVDEWQQFLRGEIYAEFWKGLKDKLEARGMDTSEGIVLCARCGGKSKSFSLKHSSTVLPMGNAYSHIHMFLDTNGVTIKSVKKYNPHVAYAGLIENPSIRFSEQALQEAAIIVLENTFMQGLERSSRGWPKITRDEFFMRLKKTNFLTTFQELQRFHPDLNDIDVVLLSNHHGSMIKGIALKPKFATDIPTSMGYSHIHIHIDADGATVVSVENVNPHIAHAGLILNPNIKFSEKTLQEAAITVLENTLMNGLERTSAGWPAISRDDFKTRLKDTNFLATFQNLQQTHPGLNEIDVVLISRHIGITIKGISLKHASAPDISMGGNNSHIHLHFDANGVTIKSIEKTNPHIAHAGLVFNPNIKFSEQVLQAAAITILENAFMHGLERYSGGWPRITRKEYTRRLKDTDFLATFQELHESYPDLNEIDIVLVSNHLRTTIKGISFKHALSRDIPTDRNFSHTHIHLTPNSTTVTAVEKRNKNLVYLALTQNPKLTIDPLLAARMRTISIEDRLLFRLSEYGRKLLLDELRRQYFASEEQNEDHKVFESITVQEFSEAAYRVLIQLGMSYVEERDQGEPWTDDDPRYTVAREISDYWSGTPIPLEYAGPISDLLIASEFRTRERDLAVYRKILRDAGKAPISGMGWDEVFSPELHARLRDFANDYFELIGVDNPSESYLRDPYNQALGAFYWQLYQEGNLPMRTEILIHIRYQKNRGDSLSEFYDGLQRQSGRVRENVMALIQHDLNGLEAQHTVWELNIEKPFRLINGIVGGAARFLWDNVFDGATHDLLIVSARHLFPNHTFEDGDNLSESLPQSLFFEVEGHATRTGTLSRPYAPNFKDGIQRLQMLMGIGEITHGAFRRGFGPGSVLELLGNIVDELMQKYPEDFRAYLEESWTYERNEINALGEVERVPVDLRRGDVLERLFQGFDLQSVSGTLSEFPEIVRGFRLGPEQNEARLMRRIEHAWQDYIADGEMDEDDAKLIAAQLKLWSKHPQLVSRPGGRWYLFEQWITKQGTDWKDFFDMVFRVVEDYL